MNERRLKQFSLPAATPSSMTTSFYKKPLWIPTNQTQPRHVDIAANTKLSTTSTSTSIHWHARVDQTSGKLPPVLGTSVDGTPIFAFLGRTIFFQVPNSFIFCLFECVFSFVSALRF